VGVLYLVRHGQAPMHAYSSDPVAPDAPGLTDLGVAQARRTGLELARQVPAFTAAVSGDLPRQRATLDGVLAAFGEVHPGGLPAPAVDPGWDEYVIPALPGGPSPDLYDTPAGYQQVLDAALLRRFTRLVLARQGSPFAGLRGRNPAKGESLCDHGAS